MCVYRWLASFAQGNKRNQREWAAYVLKIFETLKNSINFSIEVLRCSVLLASFNTKSSNKLGMQLFNPLNNLVMLFLQTLSQLCAFDYGTKTVKLYNAPWYVQDKPRFEYRGLLLGEWSL